MTKGSAKKGTVEGICILTDLVPQVGIEEQLDTNKNAIKTIGKNCKEDALILVHGVCVLCYERHCF